MKMKDVNWQQLLLEKGERFALGVTAGVAFLLLVTSLFMPGKGLFATSPATHAKTLNDQAKTVETKLASNKPTAADLPANANPVLAPFAKIEIKDKESYACGQLFGTPPLESSARRQPNLLLPDEARAVMLHTQIKSYIFGKDRGEDAILVLKADPKDTKGPNTMPAYNPKQIASLAGRGGLSSFMNRPGQTQFQAPQHAGGAPEDAPKKDMAANYVKLSALDTAPGAKLAETVRPLRLVEIVAAFPYRKQMDEFRTKLRLPSYMAVLQEQSKEVDEDTNQPLSAFRFLGVRVQRRAVDAMGKPIAGKDKDGWENVDLESTFKPYIILAGKRTEPDEPAVEALTPEGLAMPRLLQARSDQYPKIETELKNIKETIAELENSKVDVQKMPSQFSDNFGIFSKPKNKGAEGIARPPGQPAFNPMPIGPNSKLNPKLNDPAADPLPPGHCLVRLIDVSIQPGTIYQYRIQVRMANPNYKRTDVASPAYAEPPELESDSWFVIPQNILVPPELLYFAVDQKEIDGPKNYTGMNARVEPDRRNQVVFQIHKWIENINSRRTPVGEWSVAERVFVNRGEEIGRTLRVEVPVWRETMDSFVLATDSSQTGRRKLSGVEVNFAHPANESLLVDFEGPEYSYQRAGAPQVKEQASEEVLILSSEGKLLAHDTISDKANDTREKRLQAWRDRIKELKEMKKDTGIFGNNPMKN